VLLARLARDRRWDTVLAVTPDGARAARCWPRGVARTAQGGGDLGVRMQAIAARARPGPVIVIGTDIPGVRPAHVAAAFRALGNHDAVLGAAPDGGYWLIGLRRRPRVPRVFGNVRWSTPHALADTLANMAGLRIARVATLADVDDAEGFAAAGSRFGRRVLPLP
jgi:glycosyltransferase A (GT-A) superfamily protein (DUF2064 family)